MITKINKNLSSQSKNETIHLQLLCSDTLLVLKNNNANKNGSTIDLGDSIGPKTVFSSSRENKIVYRTLTKNLWMIMMLVLKVLGHLLIS